MARQFNLIPPICEQAEYHMFQREKVEVQLPELFHKIGGLPRHPLRLFPFASPHPSPTPAPLPPRPPQRTPPPLSLALSPPPCPLHQNPGPDLS